MTPGAALRPGRIYAIADAEALAPRGLAESAFIMAQAGILTIQLRACCYVDLRKKFCTNTAALGARLINTRQNNFEIKIVCQNLIHQAIQLSIIEIPQAFRINGLQ